MFETLILPFSYNYMFNAIWVSSLVGGVCAFLSAYLMLKGWSLIGDALSHSIVPGVAGAYMLGLPFALGAFAAGGLAAGAMLFLNQRTGLKEDAIIEEKLAEHPERYDQVQLTTLNYDADTPITEPGSADRVLTFRNVHNWLAAGDGNNSCVRASRAVTAGALIGLKTTARAL